MKRKLFILDIVAVILFGLYLFSQLFISYPRSIRIGVSSAYLIIVVIRAAMHLKFLKR
jgi:hypothetical protein